MPGTNLLQTLTKPNGMTLTQTYETNRDLLIGMAYRRASSLVVQREYSYDELGRPTARNTARQGAVVNDIFAHNSRSELSSARVNGVSYGYAYDSIGNREFAVEGEDTAIYTANALNQYTRITENAESVFIPEFDADGNQTRIKTETGIWGAVYNSENRPVTFSNADSGIVVESAYDSMGRRTYKRVTLNGNVTLHQRYIYRGYLQIACIDLTRSHHPCMWLLCWDPTQRIATRPLAIQKDGTWYTYGLDLTKNVCEVFGTTGYINTAYTYTPYGEVKASGSVTQPIQWSSEFYDSELGLIYYNYRHYNPVDGRWLGRDFVSDLINSYTFCRNAINIFDVKGLSTIVIWFTQPEDGEQRNKFLKHVRNHKSNIIKWVTEIKEKANIVSEQSKTCRNNTELFDWLRCQGVNILWDNSRFNGSFDEFIKKIEDDEVVLHTRKMSETETLETLKESLVSQISMYDKSIVMGHSTNSKSFDKPYFRIRKQRSKEVLVDQEFFSFADMLITCFQGDNNMRTWFLTPANHKFEVELYPVSGTLCHHVKTGTISYTPIKIEIKILGSNIEIPEINDLGLDGIELPYYEVQPVVFP